MNQRTIARQITLIETIGKGRFGEVCHVSLLSLLTITSLYHAPLLNSDFKISWLLFDIACRSDPI